MTLKIIKIDDEFVIVELNGGQKKICPTDVFPVGILVGDVIKIEVIK